MGCGLASSQILYVMPYDYVKSLSFIVTLARPARQKATAEEEPLRGFMRTGAAILAVSGSVGSREFRGEVLERMKGSGLDDVFRHSRERINAAYIRRMLSEVCKVSHRHALFFHPLASKRRVKTKIREVLPGWTYCLLTS